MVCVFKNLYCSAQLSMSNMEKRYRNKIIMIMMMKMMLMLMMVSVVVMMMMI